MRTHMHTHMHAHLLTPASLPSLNLNAQWMDLLFLFSCTQMLWLNSAETWIDVDETSEGILGVCSHLFLILESLCVRARVWLYMYVWLSYRRIYKDIGSVLKVMNAISFGACGCVCKWVGALYVRIYLCIWLYVRISVWPENKYLHLSVFLVIMM